MHLDVVQVLRCPRDHEESGLVLVADETEGRHVITGILGCPLCEAEYPIRDGLAYFVEAQPPAPVRQEIDVMRLAAMLGLTEPGGVILLEGQWVSAAEAIEEFAEGALVLVVCAGDRLPIAPRALRAAAIDTPREHIAIWLRPKGRLVAPIAVPIPPEIVELARDAAYWVGERTEVVPVLPLTRASRWRSQ